MIVAVALLAPVSAGVNALPIDPTERELDVFRLIARGLSNVEIGQELFISGTTVKTHITHILQKLDLRDRVQAVVLAYETVIFDRDAPAQSHYDERPAR